MVKDIDAGTSGSNPNNLTNVNDRLFFSADNGTNGEALWMLIAPGADDCDDAVEVVVGESYYGTTEEAIGGDMPGCVFDTNDVWYNLHL